MKTSNLAMLSIPMLVAGSIALSGCGKRSAKNPTMISYSQVGVCKGYSTLSGDEEKTKPDEAFAVFKIETIDNSKQDSPLNLDPERFFVNQTPEAMEQKNISFRSRRFMIPDARFAQAMGVKGLARATYPANKTSEVNSYIIVPLKPEANQYSFDLTYDTTTSEEQTGANDIIAKKTNPASTKYSVTENCKELAYK